MTTQTKAPSQGLLFSEPSYSETAVWCELSEGIDPAEWAKICRKIGQLSPNRFAEIRDFLEASGQKPEARGSFSPFTIQHFKFGRSPSPDSLISRLKRIFCFKQSDFEHLPLVSIGPDKRKNLV